MFVVFPVKGAILSRERGRGLVVQKKKKKIVEKVSKYKRESRCMGKAEGVGGGGGGEGFESSSISYFALPAPPLFFLVSTL